MNKNTPTPYTHTLAAERQPENRAIAHVDAAGYVVRLQLLAPGEASDFMGFIRAHRGEPVDPADIVWPAGQQFDTDGRALTVMEMQVNTAVPTSRATAA